MTRVLDPIDTALAAVLARDGRAQYQALAEAVGMSRPGAKARVQRLLGEGTVRLAVIVHPALAQPATLAHVAMSVDGAAREVAEAIAARASADRVALVDGPYAITAQLRVADDEALARELDALRSVPGVGAVEVFRIRDVLRDLHRISAEPPPIDPDDLDRRLLRELARDGRASIVTLAKAIHLSQAATRVRLLRLTGTGAVHVTGLLAPDVVGATGPLTSVEAGLQLLANPATARTRLARLSCVSHLITGYGGYDLLCTIEATTSDHLTRGLDAVRTVPGVRVAASWRHLHVIKQANPEAGLYSYGHESRVGERGVEPPRRAR